MSRLTAAERDQLEQFVLSNLPNHSFGLHLKAEEELGKDWYDHIPAVLSRLEHQGRVTLRQKKHGALWYRCEQKESAEVIPLHH